MPINADELAARLATVKDMIREKQLESGYVEVVFRVNYTDSNPLHFYIYTTEESGIKPPTFFCADDAEILPTLCRIEEWARNLPSREELEKQHAAKKMADAIAICETAGFDVAAFKEEFMKLYDNLLPPPATF